MGKPINVGEYSDDRLPEFQTAVSHFIRDNAAELKLSRILVVGMLESIKHDIMHEYAVVDAELIDYG